MASAGSIAGGAFRLIAKRPGAVLIWLLVYFAGALGIMLVTSLIMTGTPSLLPAAPFVERPDGLPPGFLPAILAISIGWTLLVSVLMNAVFRAVLRPEQSSFASLRLGMDELRTIGLGICLFIIGFVAVFISQLLLLFIASFVGLIAGQSVGGIIMLVLTLGYFGAFVWVYIRLSALFPLTFYRRKISLDAAWDLTRGRFWTLFGAYFLVGLALFVLAAGYVWVTTGDHLMAIWAAGGDPVRMQLASAEFARRQLEMPAMTQIIHMVLGTLLGAVSLALGPGVLATATRELLIERTEMDEYGDISDAPKTDYSETD